MEPNRFQCGNIRGQAQPHISYRILSLDDLDITIKSKSVGSMKIKAINWLEEVGGFNVQVSISIQDVNTKPLCEWLKLPALTSQHFLLLKYCKVWLL